MKRRIETGLRERIKSITAIDIRKTHPTLYQSLMTLSIMGLAMGANFIFTNPAFTPLGIPKNVIAVIFIVIAVAQFFFLNVYRNLRMVRVTLAISISFMLFWGGTNSTQFFAGKASLQLPILYITLALIHIPLLTEPPINPLMKRKPRSELRKDDTK